MKVTDEDMAVTLFLDRHPGWTYAALMETPDVIVRGMKALDLERAKHRG